MARRHRASRAHRSLWPATAVAAVLICIGCGGGPGAPLRELPVYHRPDSVEGRLPPWPCHLGRQDGAPSAWSPSGCRPWRYIVVHHSSTAEGNVAAFDAMHRGKGWDELGYHFVIDNGRGGPDGAAEVGPRWRSQKWGAHCGNSPDNQYNNYGIGICLVGDFTKDLPTPAQLASLNRLVRDLMASCDIPAHCVIAHREAPGAATDCPGDRFYAHFAKSFRPELARWELQWARPPATISAK